MSKQHDNTERDTSVTDGFILRYLEGLDCPRALTVYLLYKNGEHKQLVDLEHRFDVEPYFPLRSFELARDEYLATEFLSKSDFLNTDIDLVTASMKKFREAESQCYASNRVFRLDSLSHTGAALIFRAKRKIEKILGMFDPTEFTSKVNWGPGATVSLPRSQRLGYYKFRSETGMSSRCKDFWFGPSQLGDETLFSATFPRWHVEPSVDTAYVHSVPKNSKTNRTIIIEPGINTFFQKALGKMIERRLRRVGIHLRSQADVHQKLIPSIAKSGELATVDFSMASDTLSYELVRQLLPLDWFNILDIHRSPRVRLGDGVITLQKFSSMGNGFTFELESLIFYALAFAVSGPEDYISVFGDDVILCSENVTSYRDLCESVGLTLNTKKSHSSGYFRESCGAHSFGGYDAKPLYLKNRIRSFHDLIKRANQLRRLAHRMRNYSACDRRFAKAWGYLTGPSVGAKYPWRQRSVKDFTISDGYGDTGLIVNFDEARPRYAKDYQRGYYTKFLVPAYKDSIEVDDFPLLLWRLFSLDKRQEHQFTDSSDIETMALQSSEAGGNRLPDLKSRITYRVSDLFIPEWYHLGPWT